MIKRFVIVCSILFVLLFLVGCISPEHVTEQNPIGFLDPNMVQSWIQTAVIAGQLSTTVGTTTSNPMLIGGGIAVTTIVGLIAAVLFPRKKKEGEE